MKVASSGQRILITGAGGLIGSHALRILQDTGFRVIALDRKLDRARVASYELIEGDLLQATVVERLNIDEFRLVVHCAAVLPDRDSGVEAEQAARTNSLLDRRMIELCLRKGARLIFLSGTSVYGMSDCSALKEEARLSPAGPYVSAKVESEKRMLAELPGRSTILRVSAPYGAGQRSRTVLKTFIERALVDLDLMYHGTGRREQDFTAVSDVASAIACAVSNEDVSGIFNIASGSPISMRALAELVVHVIPGTKSRVVPSGQHDPQEGNRASFDISKAREMLGWYPMVRLEDGIREWAEFLRRQQ